MCAPTALQEAQKIVAAQASLFALLIHVLMAHPEIQKTAVVPLQQRQLSSKPLAPVCTAPSVILLIIIIAVAHQIHIIVLVFTVT